MQIQLQTAYFYLNSSIRITKLYNGFQVQDTLNLFQ